VLEIPVKHHNKAKDSLFCHILFPSFPSFSVLLKNTICASWFLGDIKLWPLSNKGKVGGISVYMNEF
jgi:hypothetical protein